MPIDYDAIAAAGGLGKGQPVAVCRDVKRNERQSLDERESETVRIRSGGQCECYEDKKLRCHRLAIHVHHMLGGIGVRGRGESASAIRKQHLCRRCHEDITAKRLRRIGRYIPHWTDHYARVR